MKVISNISMCEKCKHYDTQTTQRLRELYQEIGEKPPKSIWCQATDQPEDERWKSCSDYETFGG